MEASTAEKRNKAITASLRTMSAAMHDPFLVGHVPSLQERCRRERAVRAPRKLGPNNPCFGAGLKNGMKRHRNAPGRYRFLAPFLWCGAGPGAQNGWARQVRKQ